MVINKIGQQHIDYGTNCQDYGIEFDGMKVVLSLIHISEPTRP